MKPVAIFVVIAAFAALSVAAQAETVNANQARSADDKSVAAVAGPPAAANTADRRQDQKHHDMSAHDKASHDRASSLKLDQAAPAKPDHRGAN